MRTFIAFAVLAVSTLVVRAQDLVDPTQLPQGFILVVRDISGTASDERPMHFAAGANSWDPGHPEYRLTPRSDGRWQISFAGGQLGPGTEYKIALGSWATEELDEEQQTRANRKIPLVDISGLAPGEQPVIEIEVPFFRTGDEPHRVLEEYRPLEVTGTVRRLQVFGGAGPMTGKQRDLQVWLPPGYDDPANADRVYPVLYLHDGRQTFVQPEDKPGEWGMDEAAQRLVEAGEIEPVVIVAIPQGPDRSRYAEYTTLPHAGSVPADMVDGLSHIDWLVSHVLPRVRSAFRVDHRPERVGVGGFSYGAIISMEAATRHPDTFGILLAESPALIRGTPTTYTELFLSRQNWPGRVWMTMGVTEWTVENPDAGDPRNVASVEGLFAIRDHLDRLGVTNRKMVLDPQGVHGEPAWNRRAPEALRYLFPPRTEAEGPGDRRGMIEPPEVIYPRDARAGGDSFVPAESNGAGFVIEMVDASARASDDEPPYVASNWGGWNAGDPDRRMQRVPGADGTPVWRLAYSPDNEGWDESAPMRFKFTLGGWDRVEIVGRNTDIENRSLPEIDTSRLGPGEQPVIRFVAGGFRRPSEPAPVRFYDSFAPLDRRTDALTGTFETLSLRGGGGLMRDEDRPVHVWLPPGYHDRRNANRRYPVLILQDGERVFRRMPATAGEWHADETATMLIERGLMRPIIIVGVPSSRWGRPGEYQPFPVLPTMETDDEGNHVADGDGYVAWILDTLLPALEERYRTLDRMPDGSPALGIGGAGLGGVIAAYAATSYPDRFGALLAESVPTLSEGPDGQRDARWIIHLATASEWPQRVALGVGSNEVSFSPVDEPLNAAYVRWHEGMRSFAVRRGLGDDRLLGVTTPGATHTEPAWADRLIDALQFLYPPVR